MKTTNMKMRHQQHITANINSVRTDTVRKYVDEARLYLYPIKVCLWLNYLE